MAEKTLLLKTCLCKHKPTYSSLYSYNNEIIRYSYPVKDFFYARWSANDPICRIKTSSAKKFFSFKGSKKEYAIVEITRCSFVVYRKCCLRFR